MKKYAYTLVTSPRQDEGEGTHATRELTLTLRETLVIDEGPRYHREYTIAADCKGKGCGADGLPLA